MAVPRLWWHHSSPRQEDGQAGGRVLKESTVGESDSGMAMVHVSCGWGRGKVRCGASLAAGVLIWARKSGGWRPIIILADSTASD
jgi:hypothetical protein